MAGKTASGSLFGLMLKTKSFMRSAMLLALMTLGSNAFAGDADINLPDLTQVTFTGIGSGPVLLYLGLAACVIGALFGGWEFMRCRALPVHKAMSSVSNMIWETCKTYLAQQGKFLSLLWLLIAVCIVYYFVGLPWNDPAKTHGELIFNGIVILGCSV
ncbi:MAG: sodium-translocating pyrophosphatase, partial [Verrucomicrobiota bacterium]